MRRALWILGLFLGLAFAYAPILSSAALVADYSAVVHAGSASELVWDGRDERLRPGPKAPPLTAITLGLFRTEDEAYVGPIAPWTYRLVHLALWGIACGALFLFGRRLLLPWTGSETARAGGLAAALVLAFHPLAPFALASLDAQGPVLGTSLALVAAAVFLKGRQDRQLAYTLLALLLTTLAVLACPALIAWPALLALVEFVSTHRYRPWRVRLRTAATTLVIFGACAALDTLIRIGAGKALSPGGPESWSSAVWSSPEALASTLVGAVEKVGLLILPVNPQAVGLLGFALAGAVFLLAVQPALAAARSAPRLWGWLFFCWFLVLVLSQFLHADLELELGRLDHVAWLLPSIAITALGLGMAASAVSGVRRVWVPVVVALGYASLAHGNALPLRRAAGVAGELRRELFALQELHGPDLRILVVDPELRIQGVDPLQRAAADLVWPAGKRLPRVHTLSEPALLALLRQDEQDGLLASGAVLLVHSQENGASGQQWERHRLATGAPSATPRTWRGEPRSPDLDLDALREGRLEVRVETAAMSGPQPILSWRPRGQSESLNALNGLWFGGEEEAFGVFDLQASLPWRLGGRIRRLWFDQGVASVVRAELKPAPDALEGEFLPDVEGLDWCFPKPRSPWEERTGGRDAYVLAVLDLASFRYTELEVVREGARLRVPGAAREVAELLDGSGGPVAWSLDQRLEGVTLARAEGRSVSGDG